jgi:hypothetical protein
LTIEDLWISSNFDETMKRKQWSEAISANRQYSIINIQFSRFSLVPACPGWREV